MVKCRVECHQVFPVLWGLLRPSWDWYVLYIRCIKQVGHIPTSPGLLYPALPCLAQALSTVPRDPDIGHAILPDIGTTFDGQPTHGALPEYVVLSTLATYLVWCRNQASVYYGMMEARPYLPDNGVKFWPDTVVGFDFIALFQVLVHLQPPTCPSRAVLYVWYACDPASRRPSGSLLDAMALTFHRQITWLVMLRRRELRPPCTTNRINIGRRLKVCTHVEAAGGCWAGLV
ncbi:hypothetical protein LY78DRAFT_339742 [Colletotrichum sublineola]|nr:hypothetical protein LY78DRAFT_339742 [Colletotrichum sublineola]